MRRAEWGSSSHPNPLPAGWTIGPTLIADPDWSRKVAEGRDEEIVACLWDNGGCLRKSIYKGLPIRCTRNPAVGFEHEASRA